MPGRARRQPPALSNNGSASAHGGAGLGRGGMPLGRAGRVCVVFHSDAPLRQRRRRRALHRPRRFAGSPSLAAAGALPRAVGRATLRATRAPAEGDDRARYATHQTYDGHAHELRKSCARVRARAGAHCCSCSPAVINYNNSRPSTAALLQQPRGCLAFACASGGTYDEPNAAPRGGWRLRRARPRASATPPRRRRLQARRAAARAAGSRTAASSPRWRRLAAPRARRRCTPRVTRFPTWSGT